MIASPAYLEKRGRPEQPSDLQRHSCVIRTFAQDARALQRPDGTTQKISVDGVFEADNAYVANHAVMAGLGIGIAPFFQVRDAIENGRVEVVLEDFTLAPIRFTRCGRRAAEHRSACDVSSIFWRSG